MSILNLSCLSMGLLGQHFGRQRRALFLLAFCLLVSARRGLAQDSGSYLYQWAPAPNSNPQTVSYGYVEQMNGHLHLEFPIGEARHNRSGSGSNQVRLVYDSNFWYPEVWGTQYAWFPGESWHLLPQPSFEGFESNSSINGHYWELSDQNGEMHYFPCDTDCFSQDGQGYWLAQRTAASKGVYGPDGSLVYDSNGGVDLRDTDSNGNFTRIPYGGTIHDTSDIAAVGISHTWTAASATALGPYLDYIYSVPNSSSVTSSTSGQLPAYTEHDVNISVKSAFGHQRLPMQDCPNMYLCQITVVSQLELPDGTSFQFKYDCDSTVSAQQDYCTSPGGQSAYYGALTQMISPTGQTFRYSYATFLDAYQDGSLGLASRTDADGTWTYSQAATSQCTSVTATGCTQTITTTAPNGRRTVVTNVQNVGAWPVSELVSDASGNNLSLTKTQWDFTHPNLWLTYASSYVRKQWETVTQWDSTGSTATKRIAYSYNSSQRGDITKLQEWGYYPGTSPSFSSIADKTTYMTYYNPSSTPLADSSGDAKGGTNVVHKPSSITVCNKVGTDPACPGGGSKASQTLITYDDYVASPLVPATGVVNHDDDSYGVSQLVRGNPTLIRHWTSDSQYAPTAFQYDTTGQVVASTDANGNKTAYDYTDNYFLDTGSSSLSAYSPSTPTPTHAFATTVTLPSVNGQTFSTTAGFYYGNQKPAFTTDPNNNSTYYHYTDPLDRLTQTVYPFGWMLTQYTSPRQTDVYKALSNPTPSSGCSGCLHSTIIMDGMKRLVRMIGPDGSTSDTSYNSMGQVASVSNPYKTYSDTTYGVTYYGYDILGRVCVQGNPDNSLGSSVSCSSKGSSALSFSYLVNGGYKTDENGNSWAYLYDPLGRLSSVTEPNGTITTYGYDVLGNLTNVLQPGILGGEVPRTRSFSYDGLSRLLTATNPESGTICYGNWSGGYAGVDSCQNGYDGVGNLLAKTSPLANDNSGILTQTVSYVYDATNRLSQVAYPILPATSPQQYSYSCYQYDANPALVASGAGNFKGRLTSSWTQTSAIPPSSFVCPSSPPGAGVVTKRTILAYDAMGRVTSSQQCVLTMCNSISTPFQLAQQYDLAGDLTSITQALIPGVVPKLELASYFDGAGRLRSMQSSWDGKPNKSDPLNLFTVQSYSPASGLQNWMLGDYLSFQKTYDDRNRPTSLLVTHP